MLARYVVQCLRDRCEPGDSPTMIQSRCQALRASFRSLARELTGPILVAENRRLRRKRGSSPHWGPWVAAAVLYADVRERFPRRQDARAWNVARTVLRALRGSSPDKGEFRRKRRRIEQVAPWLMDRMVRDLRQALKAYQAPVKNPKWRVEYLLESGTLDSLEEWGGLKLLDARVKS